MKKFISIFVGVIITFAMTFSLCFADNIDTSVKVYDPEEYLTQAQIDSLSIQANSVSEKYQVDIVAVITNSTGGKSSQEYADDFFDYNKFGYGDNYDGLLLLIDLENSQLWISTSGVAQKVFTDDNIDLVLDRIWNYASNGNFNGCISSFISNCDDILYDYQNYVEQDEDTLSGTIFISVFVSLIFAGIVIAIMLASGKKVKVAVSASNYVENGSLNITRNEDIFVGTHTSRIKIDNDSNGSGRSGASFGGSSTLHTSSSGHSHGGGGRSF